MARSGVSAPEAVGESIEVGVRDRLPRPPGQRRRGVLALGVLSVVLGGLLTYQAVEQVGGRSPIVVTSRDVPVGRTITAQDVTTVSVSADAGLAVIPAAQLDHVVGSVAAVDLRRGTPVSEADLASGLVPGAGRELVPVAVKPSRLPARGLQAGDQVLAVYVPDASGGRVSASRSGQIAATVDRTSGVPDADGLVVVDLVTSAADGPRLAQEASDGRVVLVLTPRRS